MKKLTTLLLFMMAVGCATQKVQEIDEATSGKVTDAPTVQKEAPQAAKETPKEEEAPPPPPPKVEKPATPSQYAALNEAIKSQVDEKIYQASTQILAQSPNDPRASNALAMYHYKRGRYDLCRYLLTKSIAANPKTAELYSNLGIVQLAQDEKRDAIKSFRKALEIDNEDAVAAANVGALYVQEKDYAKAVVALETAYRKGVRDPRVLNNYAIALTANGKFDKAADIYKGILKDSSSSKEALYNYAILLVDHMGKYQEGIEVINRLKFVGGPADTRNKIIALENKAKAGLK